MLFTHSIYSVFSCLGPFIPQSPHPPPAHRFSIFPNISAKKQMLKIPKIILALRLFIFSILQNLRNILFWKWSKTEPSQQYLRQLPAELIDESLRFLSHKKCLELSKSSKSYHLANLAEYRAKRFPKKLANPAFVNAKKKRSWKQKLLFYFGMVTLEEHSQLRKEHNQLNDYIGTLVATLQKGGINVPPFPPMLSQESSSHRSSINKGQHSAEGSGAGASTSKVNIPKKQRTQKKKW